MNLEQLPKWAIPAAVGVVSFAAGAAVGYFATKRQYDRIEGELQELESNQLAFDFNTSGLETQVNRLEFATKKMTEKSEAIEAAVRDMAILRDLPVEATKAKHPSQIKNDPRNIVVEKPEEESEVIHIFAQTNADPDWDYETECARRTPDKPYIIHRDEFFADEMGIQELTDPQTLTYYAGDGILVDERDTPIFDIEKKIGALRFGHGSGDEAIFYVRNEVEGAEFEVVEDDGYYQEIILGEEVERAAAEEDLRHARRPGKFRDD